MTSLNVAQLHLNRLKQIVSESVTCKYVYVQNERHRQQARKNRVLV